ncbi:MAG: PorT family protein [Cytophagaceae bacterium]|jgi:opacity protein-like surface antigen|nr:PorT family protein [Cytophagaceae bacterium]
MKLYTFVFLLLCCANVFAQRANIGFRGGISWSEYRGKDFKDTAAYFNSRVQPTFGVFANYYLDKYLWIKTEFNYMNRSFSRTDSDGQVLRENYYYLDIHPITPSFHFKGFQAFVGPAVSLLLISKKDSVESLTGSIKTYSDVNMVNKNRYDLGFVAGIEYEFKERYNIGFRYTHGFTSIFQTPLGAEKNTQWYNQSFLFTIGYSFGIKSEVSEIDYRGN